MKKSNQLNTLMLDQCFQEMHRCVAAFIKDGFHDEAFSAALHLVSSNIVTWAKTYQINTEQFMEQAFEEVTWMVHNVEERVNKAKENDD